MDKLKKLWDKIKQHKKQVVIGAVVVAAISAGLVIYNHNSDSGYVTVDINQLYEISTSKTYGDASVNFKIVGSHGDDLRAFIKDIILKLYPDSSNVYEKYFQYYDYFNDLKKQFEFNKSENISPGDEIIATLSYDKSTAKDLKLKLKNTTLKLTA